MSQRGDSNRFVNSYKLAMTLRNEFWCVCINVTENYYDQLCSLIIKRLGSHDESNK